MLTLEREESSLVPNDDGCGTRESKGDNRSASVVRPDAHADHYLFGFARLQFGKRRSAYPLTMLGLGPEPAGRHRDLKSPTDFRQPTA